MEYTVSHSRLNERETIKKPSLMIMNWLHSIWIPVKINAIDYARIECRVSVSFFSFVHMAQVAMLQISNAYNSLID